MGWVGGGAFGWVVAALLSLIASIKFHSPGFWADTPLLTYGRVRVAALQGMWWGGAVPLLFGAMLGWMGRSAPGGVRFSGLALLGAIVWHLGACLGIVGVLLGHTTGYDGWGMPNAAVWVCVAGLLLFTVSVTATFHNRGERGLQLAHGFLWAGYLWLGWVSLAAFVLLGLQPVRGVLQWLVDAWYVANAQMVAGTLLGWGILYAWLPVWTGRPLYSRYLGMMTFLGLVMLAGWTGVTPSAPVPAWLPVLATVTTVLCIVPWTAAWLNWRGSVSRCGCVLWRDAVACFAVVGCVAFFWSAVGKLGLHVPGISTVLEFTWWEPARHWAHVCGFLGLTGVAGTYAWLRSFPEREGRAVAARTQFWCLTAGLVLCVAPLAVAGIVQGLSWQDPSVPNVEVLRRTLMWLRLSTVGELLMLVGWILFCVTLSSLALKRGRACWSDGWRRITTPLQEQETAK
ncbi:MAG: cbb3-type cytochrome c oxidase subunit I [Verrucomicrobiota bacterium]|nr:cbb3-type cytochrome c oxidase subunit I [Limisphaera sp.]MDW8381141.1 cbb3-type cytochrome c oxidase subunit I [Verrucomicrobiota bacterium]